MVTIVTTCIICLTVYLCLPRIPTNISIALTNQKTMEIIQPPLPVMPPAPQGKEPETPKSHELLTEINNIMTAFTGGPDVQE